METIRTLSVPGADAPDIQARYMAGWPASGQYPVVLGSEKQASRRMRSIVANLKTYRAEDPVREIIRRAAAIDVEPWFTARYGALGIDPAVEPEPDGEWARDSASPIGPTAHLKPSTSKPLKQAGLALVPTRNPAEVFAHLCWGGWNNCPTAEEHVAVHHYWVGKYGGGVISVTQDVVECEISHPPQDRPAAIALAREQYAYCPDVVDQGTGTLASLAAGLLQSKYWYFWWD
ncbi:MAG: DUF4253 domain-containing protein [Planctomycetes bacterium]|nr:DUF4253 domain-containing protein [Planctomycetota bacterium]